MLQETGNAICLASSLVPCATTPVTNPNSVVEAGKVVAFVAARMTPEKWWEKVTGCGELGARANR